MNFSFRTSRFILFFFCHELLVSAYYFQFVDGLEPCPLCIFQRLAFAGMGLLFLLAALHNPRALGKKIYNYLTLVPTLVGVVVAARHVWLQHLPKDEVPTCGPGLNYLLDNFPLSDALDKVFRGSGECAEVSWRILGFSMPELTLIIYIAVAVFLGWSIRNISKKSLPW